MREFALFLFHSAALVAFAAAGAAAVISASALLCRTLA